LKREEVKMAGAENGETLKIEDLREVRGRKMLIVLLNNEGEILGQGSDFETAELFGFDKTRRDFRSFLNSSFVIGEEIRGELIGAVAEDKDIEFDKDFLIKDKCLHLHFFVYRIADGKIFIIRDETELTFYKREIESLLKDHLDSLALISHESLNPLVTAGGYTKSLIRQLEEKDVSSAETLRILEIIAEAVTRAERMLRNIMEAEQMEHGAFPLRREKIDIYEDVIGKVLGLAEIAEAMARKRIVIDHTGSMKPGQARLFVDRHGFIVVFRNLFENALRHVPAEGRLTYGVKDCGTYYEFNVFNTGSPIPDEIADRVFQKHFQQNKENKGFGLGLYLTKRIIEAHGGKAWIERGKTDGVNVIFTLPKNGGV